ncbi:MAG: oxygen-independent coproporphyrinogen III oxidase [Myxococcaceae bacterium]
MPTPLMAPPEELVRRYETAGPRYTSYPTAPSWTSQFGPADYASRLEEASRAGPGAPLSVYVHVPFCRKLCTFCGCNVVISRDTKQADLYLDQVAHEIELTTARLGRRNQVSQIHWGGGTPTFLDERQLERLWTMLTKHFAVTPDAEVSSELNPAVTTHSQLAQLRALGFNRLSMGVQDFDPLVQKTINRIQSMEQTRGLLDEARRLGFGGVNFDLVYGLPHQNDDTWVRTLDAVVAMRPDRFAIYAFAFLPGTIVHQRKLPVAAMPSGPAKLSLLQQATSKLLGAGYRAIGMDHFALPEDELSVAQERRTLWRNFQGYTVRSALDVVAFGCSAISDVAGAYAQNDAELPGYSKAVAAGGFATHRGVHLTADDLRRRTLITGLMCNFWVDLGEGGPAYFARELELLRPMEQDGLLKLSGRELTVTALGRFFVRNIAMVFDAHLEETRKRVVFSKTV